MKEVKQIKIKKGMRVDELVKEMNNAGVMGGGRLGKAVDIVEAMVKDKDCKVFLGIAGALVPGGQRELLIEMIENKWIDVLVTTGANLTHDLAEALGYHHIQGSSKVDDSKLRKQGYDRMYDSYMPEKVYGSMENFFEKNFDTFAKCETIKEFLWEVGRLTSGRSMLKACYENKIPVFCPAISDSGIGLMIWGRLAKGKKININAFEDLKEIIDIAWTAKKTGVIYLGGGVPKNYIQQAMQLTNGASYGLQVTMDRPEHGGSSGAELKEGISWGKLDPKGSYTDLICDVTIALPIIVASLKDRL